MMMTVNGTHKNIPGIPHIEPHKANESSKTKGLKFKRLPMRRGSRILPTVNCNPVIAIATMKNGAHPSNCTSVKSAGNAVAIIEPMVGMKFRRNIKTAQKLAESTPIHCKIK